MAWSLADIQRGNTAQPPRMLIHGVPGVGKSTFGANLPNPVFIQVEDGLAGIDCPAFPLAKSLADVTDQLGAIYQADGEFGTVVIDTVDALERLIWAQVAIENQVKHIEDIGFGKGYAFAIQHWQMFLNMCNALRDKGMIVCLLCHTSVKRFQSPITDAYDRYEMALHKSASALLIEYVDIAGFANWQVMTRSEDAGFNKKNTKGIGTGRRKLHLEERPAWIAKNRYSLPDEIDFDWPTLVAAMNPNKSQEA
jgi:hypothetical protein